MAVPIIAGPSPRPRLWPEGPLAKDLDYLDHEKLARARMRSAGQGGSMTPGSLIIVDDNATFIDVISRYVGSEPGLEIVGTAPDGSSAVELARQAKPDLIILDLGMPGLTGIEVLPLLRVASPGTRIIILTLLDTEAYRSAALKAGADAFISKAALSAQLLPKIHELLEGPQSELPK